MKQWQLFSTLFMFMVSSLCLAGEVYVCEKNGRKEFSQLPCGENAVLLQMEGEPNSIKVSIPFKAKEITAICQLAIKAKDRAAQRQKAINQAYTQSYRAQSYNRHYNYNTYPRYPKSNSNDNPQTYFLNRIENLEMIAKNSPEIYQMLKGLVHSVYYQGYDESPIYEAERTAALVNCEDNLNRRMEYMQHNN